MRGLFLPLALGLVALLAAPARAEGDAEAGRRAYTQCMACHALAAESRATGPSLQGVYGRKAGTLQDFRYSRAMQESGITWNAESLDSYLAAPQTAIRGNRMAFAGLRDQKQRQDVIAFLRTLQ